MKEERGASTGRSINCTNCTKYSAGGHLQGPELRHVVETGHRQSADVVVVEGAEERGEQKTRCQSQGCCTRTWRGDLVSTVGYGIWTQLLSVM